MLRRDSAFGVNINIADGLGFKGGSDATPGGSPEPTAVHGQFCVCAVGGGGGGGAEIAGTEGGGPSGEFFGRMASVQGGYGGLRHG